MHNLLRKLKLWIVPASRASTRARRIKEELHTALKGSRPRGIELDANDADPDLKVAVDLLVKEHAELTVMRTGKSLSLFYRADLDPMLPAGTKELLTAGDFLIPGGSPVKGGLFND